MSRPPAPVPRKPASRCGYGALTARRPARPCVTSESPCSAGTTAPNSTACSPRSASRRRAPAARRPVRQRLGSPALNPQDPDAQRPGGPAVNPHDADALRPGSPAVNPTHTGFPRRPIPLMSGVSLTLGLLAVGWPLAWAPAWTYLVAGLGAVAALAAAFIRWRRGPALAMAAAIVS